MNGLTASQERRWVLLFVLLGVLFHSPRAVGQTGNETTGPGGASALLSAGDVVRVEIWMERELSGEFLVGPDGTATFPLIGVQQVSGTAVAELRMALLEQYRRYLRNPSINITPLRRVQVLGEVNRPGVYMLDPTVSLSGAIAVASGANGNGDPRKIRIVRNGRVFHAQVGPATTLSDAAVRSGDQIVVGQKNWIVRNSTFVVSVLIALPTTLATILSVF